MAVSGLRCDLPKVPGLPSKNEGGAATSIRRTRAARTSAGCFCLVAVNAVALFVAVVGGWSLIDLMTVYWVQSVMIGIGCFYRILHLDRFSTEDFRINNRSVDPTPETKRKTAAFSLFHFGFFHLGYLIFILTENQGSSPWGIGLLICSTAFAVNHYYSYRYHRETDRSGTPNIGTLMFTPYLRVVPMHLTEHRLLARRNPG